MTTPTEYLNKCCRLAQKAANLGEIPVGAIIVQNNVIIATSHNEEKTLQDPTAHAEVLAIREACSKLQSSSLMGCDLYTSLEPCLMCYQAAKTASINNIYYAFTQPNFGVFSQDYHTELTHSSAHQLKGIGPFPSCTPKPPLHDFFKDKR